MGLFVVVFGNQIIPEGKRQWAGVGVFLIVKVFPFPDEFRQAFGVDHDKVKTQMQTQFLLIHLHRMDIEQRPLAGARAAVA